MSEPAHAVASRWWVEAEFWLLTLSLTLVMLVRLNDAPLRGEEPRRAEVAVEMRYFGDWVVPRQYGAPFLSRPPMHAWLIAAAEAVCDSHERWVLRLPCVFSVLGASLLLYGYSRQFFGRIGAVAAALAYATGGEVLTQSQLAETEPPYVLFISASLLIWHWGYVRAWRPIVTWGAAYALAALAWLTKGGLQPQVYLLGAAVSYLLWKRNVRYLLSTGHALGMALGLAIVAAWVIPSAGRVGWETTYRIGMSDTTSRFMEWRLYDFASHLLKLPVEVFGSLMPWGLLGAAFLVPSFRRRVFAGPDCLLFCAAAVLVAWPTVWLPPGGLTRYFTPMYPCLAVLFGGVIDATASGRLEEAPWRRFLVFWDVGLFAFAVAVAASGSVLPGTRLAGFELIPARAGAYGLACGGLAIVLWACRRSMSVRAIGLSVWGVAAAAVVVNLGPLTDARLNRLNNVEAFVDKVRDRVPPEESLYAVFGVHPSVPYLLERPAPLRMVSTPEEVPAGGYFCINCENQVRPDLPFAWSPLAEVAVDRMRRRQPELTVIIARRAESASAARW